MEIINISTVSCEKSLSVGFISDGFLCFLFSLWISYVISMVFGSDFLDHLVFLLYIFLEPVLFYEFVNGLAD